MLGRVAGRFPDEDRSGVADARFCTVRLTYVQTVNVHYTATVCGVIPCSML